MLLAATLQIALIWQNVLSRDVLFRDVLFRDALFLSCCLSKFYFIGACLELL